MSDEVETTPPRNAITADDLRRVAEWADGVRGGEYRLSMNAPLPGGGTGFGLERIDGSSAPVDEIIISTPQRVPTKKSPPVFMLVDPATGENIRVDTQKHDAIFWGEVSAEKFLIPYYTRFLDDAGMQSLREAIADPDVIAIAHDYPTFIDVATSSRGFVPLSEWAKRDRSRPPQST